MLDVGMECMWLRSLCCSRDEELIGYGLGCVIAWLVVGGREMGVSIMFRRREDLKGAGWRWRGAGEWGDSDTMVERELCWYE